MPKTELTKTPYTSIRQLGIGGLVLRGDPQDIKDTESPDLRNIIFDSGMVGPRNGTTLFLAAPIGETGTPSQLLTAKDSNGTAYLIGVYGINFYLLDPVNKAWVKLNGSYSPIKSGLFYGSASWNLGTGTDKFYFCNGSDLVMSWIPFLTYLGASVATADTQLTVLNASLLPSSGQISVAGTAVTITYNQTQAIIQMTALPTDGETLILTVNGTAITLHFVASIGASAGNVLIGSSVAATMANLQGLLSAPSVTNATQVALSAGNQTLVGYFTTTLPGSNNVVIMTPSTSVQSIVVAGTSAPTVTYSNPTNIIALSAQVGTNIANNSAITNVIVPVASIPIGNVLVIGTASGAGFRLFISGVNQYENYVFFSKAFNWTTPNMASQEDFTTSASTFTGSGLPGNGGQPIPYGEGGVVDMVNFGAYLAAIKSNGLANLAFTIDATNDTTDLVPSPLIFGESVFPIGQNVDITIENSLYVPTLTEGIYQLTPASTGNTLTTNFTPFSDNILSLFKMGIVSFANGRSSFFNRALYIPCSTIPGVNNLVLVYDFLWQVWSIWDNLNAADMQESNGTFYVLCNDDGGLYYIDVTSYQDFRSGQAVGYTTYLYTKRFDWGKPANIKQQSLAMLQGYIMGNTKLYVDVLYNENGTLAAATYEIDGSNMIYVQQVPIYGPGRISLGQNPIGGAQSGTIGVFRVYLDLSFGVGAHVIQFRLYSVDTGANWAATGLSVNPDLNEVVPSELIISVV